MFQVASPVLAKSAWSLNALGCCVFWVLELVVVELGLVGCVGCVGSVGVVGSVGPVGSSGFAGSLGSGVFAPISFDRYHRVR